MSSPPEYFRAGAGAVIIKDGNLVLAFRRSDTDDDTWQCPQGGLNAGEVPLAAAYRETSEETGISEEVLKEYLKQYPEPLGTYPEPLAYELPSEDRSEKTGRGQVHHWFFFQFRGSENAIDVSSGGEFRAWKWMPFQSLPSSVVPFRKHVYEHLYEWFRENIRESGAEKLDNGLPPDPA